MRDDLSSIERAYGSVAEYNRCMYEEENSSYEDRNYAMLYDGMEIPYEEEPKRFEIGNRYRQVGFYGGVTYYTVKEIDREKNRIKLAETWVDLDGSGKRPAKWHKLSMDEHGNEMFLEWTSGTHGDIWINA